jgi:predicted ArsR family transcriptional regulator
MKPISLPQRPVEATAPEMPLGHRGPRAELMIHLKSMGQATARELAEALGCSLNAVRHHLKELEAEGLVTFERAHRGVGAPAHAYRLSAQGHALFPDRYARTVSDLLDHLLAQQGREAVVELLKAHYHALARRIEAEVAASAPERRGEVVARVLAAEGYMATWADGDARLTEHNCPHQLVAERFPEVCEAEEAFLARAFRAGVERLSRIAGGCGTCSYAVGTREGAKGAME